MSNDATSALVLAPSAAILPIDSMSDEEFAVACDTMKRRDERLLQFVKSHLREGTHFGLIPGTREKSLWQPGADRILDIMGIRPRYEISETHGDGIEHPHVRVTAQCIGEAVDPNTQQMIAVAHGVGACSTWERKYRYRTAWQETGAGRRVKQKIDNPDPYDQYHTIVIMACKRAKVATAKSIGPLSGMFTQDLDEDVELAKTGGGGGRAAQQSPGPDATTLLEGDVRVLKAKCERRARAALIDGGKKNPTQAEVQALASKVFADVAGTDANAVQLERAKLDELYDSIDKWEAK